MLLSMLMSGRIDPVVISIIIVVALIAMTVHEFAHAWMANWWGDDTAKSMGRMTLNPVANINWVGFFMFVFLGFGILGSVPVQTRKMRNPRWGSFWTSFAGPLSNLILAFAFAIVYRIMLGMDISSTGFAYNLVLFTFYSVYMNLLLFAFNLLPFFPIDGWHMVLALLPARWLDRQQVPDAIRKNVHPLSMFLQQPAYKWEQWAQASQIVLMILVFISFANLPINPLSWLISAPIDFFVSIFLR